MHNHDRGVCATDALLFMVGAGLGVGLGIILAPKSGQETRDAIREKVSNGKEFVARQGNELKAKATDLADKSKETLERHRSSVTAALDAGRQAYRETVESV